MGIADMSIAEMSIPAQAFPTWHRPAEIRGQHPIQT
jgi:hypothetical protein